MKVTVVSAQEDTLSVFGVAVDSYDKTPLIGATVLMVNVKDSLRSKYAIADEEGKFNLGRLEKAFYRLKVTFVGYEPYTRIMRVSLPETDLGVIQLKPDSTILGEVVVEGEVVAVQQIGDTTQYNAAAFKTNPDATAGDLVSKMPGIVVSSEGVSSNGESVEQVLLDGKRFFGQDPLLSLNTIPAEIVDKVQVYDEQSDQSQFTGFDDGNTSLTMNLVTKKDKRNGQFGNVYAGAGEEGLYKAGATINSFNQDSRLTFLGVTNNINQQNFGSEDLVGTTTGGRGGGPRGDAQSFNAGTQDGITRTNAIGLNFTDDWGENTTFEGSYFYNQTKNNNDQLLSRESFLTNGTQYYSEDQSSLTENTNHRLNLRVSHEINDMNNILFRGSFSYQNNNAFQQTFGQTTNSSGSVLNQTYNNYSSSNEAFNMNGNLIYQHKFNNIGRTISIDLNSRINPTNRDNLYEDLVLDSLIKYDTDENVYVLGSNITYTEPVGTSGQLSLGYNLSSTYRNSNVQTFVLQDESDTQGYLNNDLSSNFESRYTQHVPTLRYSRNSYGNIFDVSLSYQYATLSNEQLFPYKETSERSFSNLLGSATWRMNFGEGGDIMARYSSSTSAPTATQLQTVIDNSDPLFVSVGNPSLDQSYSHALDIRLQKNYFDQNITLANRISVATTSDYIGTGTTIIAADSVTSAGVSLVEGAQVSSPINLDGYWSVRNNTSFGMLISPIQNNLNISAGLGYTRLPGMTNEVENLAQTYSADLKVGLASNISEKVDYNIYYQVAGSRVFNSIQSDTYNQYFTQTVGASLNLILPWDIVFRNETLFQKYNGVNNSFDTQYTLWNMAVAKKFLKDNRGELELSVFDLLGENESFNQTVTAQYLQETQTQVLQRYFMLTFTYQLRMFK